MHLKLTDNASLIQVTAGVITPSSYTPIYLSLKGYERLFFFMRVATATIVTPIAVTLLQAKTVAAGSTKALGFTKALRSLDYAANSPASQAMSEFDVVSNTFTFDATESVNHLYGIEVNRSLLDVGNDFDCVAIAFANGTAQTVNCIAAMLGAKDGRTKANPLVN